MTTLQDRIAEVCREIDNGVEPVGSYSGRGMYGRSCFGISGSRVQCMDVIKEVIKSLKAEEVAEEEFSDALDMLFAFKQDNMGYDAIIYWEELDEVNDANTDGRYADDEDDSDAPRGGDRFSEGE